MTIETVQAPPDAQQAFEDQVKESPLEAVKRLAVLPSLEYEKVRNDEAKKLGISRLSVLDEEVSKARKANKPDDEEPFADIEPYPDSIEPAQLLDEISATIRRFIVLDKYQSDIAALWVAVCWFVDDIHTAPIALINAPEKACGKTQLLTLLRKLAPRATQLSGISPSVLFRMIEKYQPTLFVDEIETVLKDNEDLRGLLNAGHTRDSAFVWRSVASGDDYEAKRFKVWGMKAIAGINAIKLAETVTSRSIIFELRRKKSDESVERLRYAESDLFDTLTAKLARFSNDYSSQIKQARPSLPDELGDREQDNIEPLLQVASVAYGHWPDTAVKAALKIFRSAQDDNSSANELLSDIQEIFETKGVTKISTADLIEALVSDDEKAWQTYNRGKQLAPRQLARKLKDYKISSKTIRLGYNTAKGYELSQFTDAFERYLTQSPTFYPSQNNISLKGCNDASLRVTDDVTTKSQKGNNVTNVTDSGICDGTQKQKETPEPAPTLGCDVVTDKTPREGKGVRI